MKRRTLSIFLAAGLVASVFATAGPVSASHVEIPNEEDANIVDQLSDANYHSTATGSDAGPSFVAADIVIVWFTHDAEFLYTHLQTSGTAQLDSILYRVWVDPGVGSACMAIQAVSGGGANEAAASLRQTGDCGSGTEDVGEFIQEPGPAVLSDGRDSGIHTIKMPRSAHESFADNSTLATPEADSSHNIPGVVRGVPIIDDTEVGTDYTITGEEQFKEEPPGKKDPPGKGKKKGCKKGKGKKKGACPPGKKKKKKPAPPVLSCAPYQPGEQGAEADTTVLKDEATEEEPVELAYEFPEGIPETGQDSVFHNVQVDTSGAESGLYVRFEFADYEDMDLYLFHPSGTQAARAAGYNPAPVLILNDTGNGGHTEVGAEQLDGIKTSDCQGFTIDMRTFQNFSGEKTLKLWLGEVQNDPAPDQRALVATVFGLF